VATLGQENLMFCVHCGKSNVENASFCAFCGKSIVQSLAIPVNRVDEWEYTFYRRNWKMGKGGRWNLTFGKTEYDVRLDNWGSDQDHVMRELQAFLDKGWQFVSSPGPNSYRFFYHEDYAGGVKFTWLEVSSFVVDLRRPARSRTEKEKQVLGVWQEVNDPNNGFWKTVGNVIFSQKLAVDRWCYEFIEDRTFRRTDRDGEERDGGIFFENDKGEIQILYKFSPESDGFVRLTDNRLFINSGWEFERISP